MKINPFLIFNGNCREAFDFYKAVFGGRFQDLKTFKDLPPEYQVDPSFDQLIMHVTLPISEETILMGSDVTGDVPFIQGNNFSIMLSAENDDECTKLYQSLCSKGEEVMPLAPSGSGPLFGMCRDRFGIAWMIGSEGV
jgi:PhnB protein